MTSCASDQFASRPQQLLLQLVKPEVPANKGLGNVFGIMPFPSLWISACGMSFQRMSVRQRVRRSGTATQGQDSRACIDRLVARKCTQTFGKGGCGQQENNQGGAQPVAVQAHLTSPVTRHPCRSSMKKMGEMYAWHLHACQRISHCHSWTSLKHRRDAINYTYRYAI